MCSVEVDVPRWVLMMWRPRRSERLCVNQLRLITDCSGLVCPGLAHRRPLRRINMMFWMLLCSMYILGWENVDLLKGDMHQNNYVAWKKRLAGFTHLVQTFSYWHFSSVSPEILTSNIQSFIYFPYTATEVPLKRLSPFVCLNILNSDLKRACGH